MKINQYPLSIVGSIILTTLSFLYSQASWAKPETVSMNCTNLTDTLWSGTAQVDGRPGHAFVSVKINQVTQLQGDNSRLTGSVSYILTSPGHPPIAGTQTLQDATCTGFDNFIDSIAINAGKENNQVELQTGAQITYAQWPNFGGRIIVAGDSWFLIEGTLNRVAAQK
jgi:hypothetical protein